VSVHRQGHVAPDDAGASSSTVNLACWPVQELVEMIYEERKRTAAVKEELRILRQEFTRVHDLALAQKLENDKQVKMAEVIYIVWDGRLPQSAVEDGAERAVNAIPGRRARAGVRASARYIYSRAQVFRAGAQTRVQTRWRRYRSVVEGDFTHGQNCLRTQKFLHLHLPP
jgi:hypothetical protein